jgi:hypothetical protein
VGFQQILVDYVIFLFTLMVVSGHSCLSYSFYHCGGCRSTVLQVCCGRENGVHWYCSETEALSRGTPQCTWVARISFACHTKIVVYVSHRDMLLPGLLYIAGVPGMWYAAALAAACAASHWDQPRNSSHIIWQMLCNIILLVLVLVVLVLPSSRHASSCKFGAGIQMKSVA